MCVCVLWLGGEGEGYDNTYKRFFGLNKWHSACSQGYHCLFAGYDVIVINYIIFL